MEEFGYKYFPLSYVWMGGVEGDMRYEKRVKEKMVGIY